MRTATRSPRLTVTTRMVAVVFLATTLCLTADNGWLPPFGVRPARAAGPITLEQCYILNPNPTVTDCSTYVPPVVDIYNNLPYDTVPSYAECVRQRCVCTGATTTTDVVTVGQFCSSAGWAESGFTTCNVFNDCFTRYWRCLNRVAYERYVSAADQLVESEVNLIADITLHAGHPGESFEVTDVFRSCRLSMCAAASSRQNCGLITCLPNYTQCDEFIQPSPMPYTHHLCTQGCRAALLMMALTLALISFSMICCCCCPAQVRIREPVVLSSATGDKKNDSNSTSNKPDGPER